MLQLFLTNLQNILKFDILATKTEDHQLTKMVLQMVTVRVSRVLCYWHSLHMLKILFIIRQNMVVPVQLAGKLDNLFYAQIRKSELAQLEKLHPRSCHCKCHAGKSCWTVKRKRKIWDFWESRLVPHYDVGTWYALKELTLLLMLIYE